MQFHEETYQKDLLRLITEVVKIQDYSHLLKLDGGEKKAQQAKKAITALKDLSNTFLQQQESYEKIESIRRQKYEELLKNQELLNKLNEMK